MSVGRVTEKRVMGKGKGYVVSKGGRGDLKGYGYREVGRGKGKDILPGRG